MSGYFKPGYLKLSVRSLRQGAAISITVVMLASTTGFAQESGFPIPGQTSAVPTTGTVNRPILRSGSKGNEVSELQAALKLLGFYSGGVDGVYGQTTIDAVFSFQQAAGLDADGIVGPATWGTLFPKSSPEVASPSATQTASTLPTGTGATPPATRPSTSSPSGSAATAAVRQSGGTEGTATAQPTTELAFPVLRVGMRGPAVVGLQNRLRAIGVFKGGADGVFGPETQEAVRAAQRKFKLEVDGVVGPATWKELLQ
jgi:peptidoglycan hydrolase-like protein with peptidoglycan-binding domain